MREYKFRVWDTENKEMLKVQELDFEDTFYGGRLSIRTDQYNDYFDIEDMILMQYTGLKDKNGKEIYEGDIVKVKLYKGEEEKYFIGKVEYFGSNFIVDADNNSEYHIYDLDGFGIDYRYHLEDCEVIGNIYDNPELLEEGE